MGPALEKSTQNTQSGPGFGGQCEARRLNRPPNCDTGKVGGWDRWAMPSRMSETFGRKPKGGETCHKGYKGAKSTRREGKKKTQRGERAFRLNRTKMGDALERLKTPKPKHALWGKNWAKSKLGSCIPRQWSKTRDNTRPLDSVVLRNVDHRASYRVLIGGGVGSRGRQNTPLEGYKDKKKKRTPDRPPGQKITQDHGPKTGATSRRQTQRKKVQQTGAVSRVSLKTGTVRSRA